MVRLDMLTSTHHLEIGAESGCFGFGERRFSDIDDFKTYLHWWVKSVLRAVPEESEVLARLLEAGFAASPGRRFRIESAPAIRVCVASLDPPEARALADALAHALAPAARTHPV